MSISFDRVADIYDRTRGFSSYVMDKILEALIEELRGYRLLLDVGVGTGRFAEPLQEAGFEVVGIDISKRMLKKAVEKGVKNLMSSDACSLPFHDSTFDASISVHTLHLIKNWKSALRETTRVTKKSLFSILREDQYERTPSYAYKELVEGYGYSYRHPGLGEWKLKEIIKPRKSKFVTSYNISADESLAFLDQKVFSYQWNVPDDLHKKAMEKLKERFPRKMYRGSIYIHIWDIHEIKDYLKSQCNMKVYE